MSARNGRVAGLALLLSTAALPCANAQDAPATRRPSLMGALMGGAIGFTERDASSPVAGMYGYAGFSRTMVGAQAATTVAAEKGAAVRYVIATLGYPARARRGTVIYPFFGVGGGRLRSMSSNRERGAIIAAGIGADVVHSAGRPLLVGMRGGYLSRAGESRERAIYFAMAIGLAAPVREDPKRPPVVAARRSDQ
jgi:hypothetical protein